MATLSDYCLIVTFEADTGCLRNCYRRYATYL